MKTKLLLSVILFISVNLTAQTEVEADIINATSTFKLGDSTSTLMYSGVLPDTDYVVQKIAEYAAGDTTSGGIDSIYQASTGTWTIDTITKDTVYNTLTAQSVTVGTNTVITGESITTPAISIGDQTSIIDTNNKMEITSTAIDLITAGGTISIYQDDVQVISGNLPVSIGTSHLDSATYLTLNQNEASITFKNNPSPFIFNSDGKFEFHESNTFLTFGVTWIPDDIYDYSLYYNKDSLHFCWARLQEFRLDTLDRINVDTLSVTGNMLIDNFNATYSVTGDDTLGGSSAGNAIDIVTQYIWINCRTSVNTWSAYTDLNFTYDNDTIEYDGTSSTLYLHAELSLGGATQGYEFRWYNITDGAAVPGKCKYTPAAYPTPLSFTAKDVNADVNDRYVLQVRGLTATNDLLLYDGFIKITTL